MNIPKHNPVKTLVFAYVAERRRIKGDTYFPTKRDFGAAREFLENIDEDGLYDGFAARVSRYLADEGVYWSRPNWPAYSLFNNWNTWNPPPEPRQAQAVMIECSACGRVHAANAKCLVEIK